MTNKRGKIIKGILKPGYNLYKAILSLFLWPMLYFTWRKPRLRQLNERVVEYGYALQRIGELGPASVLDLGTGASSWPQLLANCGYRVTAVDTKHPLWGHRFFNRHYYIIKDDITRTRLSGHFDLITCISVLEHIPDFGAAIKGMVKLLEPRGYIVLTFPYSENCYVENVYQRTDAGYNKDASYICHVFSRTEIDAWIEDYGLAMIDQKYYQVFSGELWTTGQRFDSPLEVSSSEKHQLTCLVLRKQGL